MPLFRTTVFTPSRIAVPFLLTLFTGLALAQYTPGSKPHSYTAGNVLYPGGVPPTPPAGSPILPMGGYGQVAHSGHGAGGGHGSYRGSGQAAHHPAHAPGVIVPVYLGGGYGEPYADPQQQGAAPPPPPDEPDIVIVNQDYRPEVLNPVVHDYTNAEIPESPSIEQRQSTPPPAMIQGGAPLPQQQQDPSPTIYLIAMTDGNIVAALGYWMEGDTLNYITRDGNRNRVSISRVDRTFSAKLNADRNVEFKLE